MVTIKFKTEKFDKGQFVILPTVYVDASKKAEAKIGIELVWLFGTLAIGIIWTKKKIAAIEKKNE